jgi:hypothetical protein
MLLLAGLLGSAVHDSHAQATPTASRLGIGQIGVGWGLAKPDYGTSNIQGLTVYGSFDFTRHWGIAGDIHRNSLITPSDIGEDSYVIGPRFVVQHNRFMPYAKVQGGFARIKYQYDNAPHTTYTYKMYDFGAGLDYQATKHINVRVIDFEYQKWLSFPPNGLSPLVFSFGASYVLR